jgi:hypothetical protein
VVWKQAACLAPWAQVLSCGPQIPHPSMLEDSRVPVISLAVPSLCRRSLCEDSSLAFDVPLFFSQRHWKIPKSREGEGCVCGSWWKQMRRSQFSGVHPGDPTGLSGQPKAGLSSQGRLLHSDTDQGEGTSWLRLASGSHLALSRVPSTHLLPRPLFPSRSTQGGLGSTFLGSCDPFSSHPEFCSQLQCRALNFPRGPSHGPQDQRLPPPVTADSHFPCLGVPSCQRTKMMAVHPDGVEG